MKTEEAEDAVIALFRVRERCFFAEDDGTIGVSEDVVIDAELFQYICQALKMLTNDDYMHCQKAAFDLDMGQLIK